MSHKFSNNIDMEKKQILNLLLQILSSDHGSPVESLIYYNSTDKVIKYYTGSGFKTLVTKDELNSIIEGLAWKDDVDCATTANITLSGEQTIDGVTTSSSRVLVKNQTTQSENGIYVSGAGAWTRADDMSASEEFNSAIATVNEGTTLAGTTWRQTTVDPIVGTDNIVFAQFGTMTPDATTTVKGKAELATKAETEARTDTERVPTPSAMADFALIFSTDIGNGSDTSIVVTHNLGRRNVIVQVYDNSSPYQEIIVEVKRTSTSQVTLEFASAPTSNQYKCVVFG